jgi:hypothetical protein
MGRVLIGPPRSRGRHHRDRHEGSRCALMCGVSHIHQRWGARNRTERETATTRNSMGGTQSLPRPGCREARNDVARLPRRRVRGVATAGRRPRSKAATSRLDFARKSTSVVGSRRRVASTRPTSPRSPRPRWTSRRRRRLSLAPAVPSPVHTHARIRFTISEEEAVTLGVYDLAGRQVASLIDRAIKPAGAHEVELDTRGWRPGCYYYRLVVGSNQRTQRMVIFQ